MSYVNTLSETPLLPITTDINEGKCDKQLVVTKSVAKIVVASTQAAHVQNATPTVLQKIVSSPLITVMNSSGPLTVVKPPSSSTSTSHFTLVNSNAVNSKSSTITLLNSPSPITVVKAISTSCQQQQLDQTGKVNDNLICGITTGSCTNNGNLTSAPPEKSTLHNVFVKKSNADDISQSQKLLTANSFPASNVSIFLRIFFN